MATKGTLSLKELTCPRCCNIYVDPRLLSCKHSFCMACLEEYWKKGKSKKCPLCKRKVSKSLPPPNMHLKLLCDKFQEAKSNTGMRPETHCSLHGEKFKLFCEEDKQPVCMVCRHSKVHTGHSFRPLDEAAQKHRELLQSKLTPLQETLNMFLTAQLTCDQTAQHIKRQAQDTERQIHGEFQKLHNYLLAEEEKRIAELRKELEMKSKTLNNIIGSVHAEIQHLSAIISSTLEELVAEDTVFLKNYKDTVERAQGTSEEPQTLSGALINVAEHLGNLKFTVWEKMKDITEYSPVILDSNTAHSCLTISKDLTSFICRDKYQENLPENPERFDHYVWTLGSAGFSSGTHFWEVDVDNSEQWSVGIQMGSTTKSMSHYTAGIWRCPYQNILYGASCSGGPTTTLSVNDKLQRVRVVLDCDRGRVTFSDLINGHHLHTFRHTFTDTIFPYFSNHSKIHPLKILPKYATVVIKKANQSTNEQDMPSEEQVHHDPTPETTPRRARNMRRRILSSTPVSEERTPQQESHFVKLVFSKDSTA